MPDAEFVDDSLRQCPRKSPQSTIRVEILSYDPF